MQNNLLSQEYLKNEKIQIFLRLIFISIFIVIFYYDYNYAHSGDYGKNTFVEIIFFPLFVIVCNTSYFFILKYFPYTLQKERIILIIFLDVGTTIYVMYLVGSLGAYFAGALLWFSIGYGMRYGKMMAYTAYVAILVAWVILMNISPFWRDETAFALGWFVTFLVVPLYYFRLVSQLHENITLLHKNVEDEAHKAKHDELTGLGNRYLFDADLKELIEAYANNHVVKFALFFVDLDAFKEINDQYGHDIGDKVLKEASRRLESIIPQAYRLGGDEFVCMTRYESEYELKNIAKNLLFNLTMPCKNSDIRLGASIGIARFPADADKEFDIKKRADLAMYAAKEAGKNRFYFYSDVA